MQHVADNRVKTYVIPADAYGRRLRGWVRLLVWFASYFLLVFLGDIFIDLIFKNPVGSSAWMRQAVFKSLFMATWMSLFAVGKDQRLSGLEVTGDALVLYEGEPLDPLYRHGRVVPASEIRRVRELKKTWFRKSAGLAVVYGRRFPLFVRNQQFIPSKTPQYSEIRDTLMALSSTAS